VSINKEEIDKWLNEEYGCSYTRLEELHDFYFEKYCDLKDRISKAREVVKEIKLHYQQHPTMIPSVKIHRLDEILGGKE
jgi:hypothetical protein